MLTHKGTSLITGLSRAKRISPYILEEKLELKGNVQNLAHTEDGSPYGAYYFSYLKEKLKSNGEGIHIVCVSPTSIMNRENEPEYGRESNKALYLTNFKNTSPNLEYLWNQSFITAFKALKAQTKRDFRLKPHKNGWLEPILGNRYKKRKVGKKGNYSISSYRIEYLKKTILYLKSYDRVFIVRMPVSSEMYAEENKLFPKFDETLSEISKDLKVPIINFSTQGQLYNYDDIPGHHLDLESSKLFTNALADSIKIKAPSTR